MTISTGISARQRLGDFEVIREIGRGGMGVVFEARQVSLNRPVALKVLSSSLGLSAQAVPRFRREAEAAAKLHHTNIVPIYATGAENGTHFYAMELIDGPSLDSVIRHLRQSQADKGPSALPNSPIGIATTSPSTQSRSAPDSNVAALTSSSLSSNGHYFDSVAKMMAEVADALDYAHQQGVIHRDLKPSNLLLSPEGRLSVNDFGLARMLEQPGMTMTGEFVGTPAYMSPEQITAGRVPVNHRTDIYSLGATLYEMLTLQPPFTGNGRDQLLAQILHKEPLAPRRVTRKVPVDLETICLKAIDKDPDRRYQTAGQLAEDLRRYVNRFAIAARRASPVERLRKWVKRHPGIAAALALVVISLFAAGYSGYRMHLADVRLRAEQKRHEEELIAQQKRREEEQKRYEQELIDQQRQNALEKATEAALSGDLERARKAIVEAEAAGVSADQVHWLHGLVHYQGGTIDDAIQEFESAIALKPTVAARAMLSRAHSTLPTLSGSAWREEQNELYLLKPITPEDYMCLGYALRIRAEWEKSLSFLDKAITMRDSPIARAFRARARSDVAMDAGDLKLTERAKEDMQQAKLRLPDNPFVRVASLDFNLQAADLYGETNQTNKQKAALEQAKGDAEALTDLPVPGFVMSRVCYFEHTGQDAEALELLKQASQRAETKGLIKNYVLALYRKNSVKEALDVLEGSQQPENRAFFQALRPFLLAEIDHGTEKAYERIEELPPPPAPYQRNFLGEFYFRDLQQTALPALLFFGNRAEAAKVLQDAARASAALEPDAHRSPNQIAEYITRSMSEEEFLKTAGGSRFDQGVAHYWVGMVRLSEGDRQGARESFAKSVATQSYIRSAYSFSRIFLERLKQDDKWPPWIQVKER